MFVGMNNEQKVSMGPQELISAYQPSTMLDAVAKMRMLALLKLHQDQAFYRSCMPGHFTASAWVLGSSGKHVLLLQHVKLNCWLQPGGHCDGDQDFLAVATKEAYEETGLRHIKLMQEAIFDVDVHLIPPRKNELSHYHYDVRFLFEADDAVAPIKNHESEAVAWVPLDQVATLTQETSILRMVEKSIGSGVVMP